MAKVRYYTNIGLNKDQRSVLIANINSANDDIKLDNKLLRNENLIECNKSGTPIGEENSDVLEAYQTIATLKKQVETLLEHKAILTHKLSAFLDINTIDLDNTVYNTDLKNDEVEMKPVGNITTVKDVEEYNKLHGINDSVPVNISNDDLKLAKDSISSMVNSVNNSEEVVVNKGKKAKPRKMKRSQKNKK